MGPGYLQSIIPNFERLGCKRRVHPISSLAIAFSRPWLCLYLPLPAQPLPVENLQLVSDRILSSALLFGQGWCWEQTEERRAGTWALLDLSLEEF